MENKIPIKNIYYMLCYAWDVLSIKDDFYGKVSNCPDVDSLLASMFSYGVEKQIKYGLRGDYIETQEELSLLKGKISIKESVNKLSLVRNKLVCCFDDYSINNKLNGIIKYTIISLINNRQVNKEIKGKLKKYLDYYSEINALAPKKRIRKEIRLDKNSCQYKLLISLAYTIYDNTSPSEEAGKSIFKNFYREKMMEKVFEKFLLNFYKQKLDLAKYDVRNPYIRWQLNSNDEIWQDLFDIDKTGVNRRTDITIVNKDLQYQIIVDAKYYEKTFVNAYMTEEESKIRVSHLNQVRGYLVDSDYNGTRYGALIYPTTNVELSKGVILNLKETPIVYKTVNLYDDWNNIENDLLEFINKFESAHQRIT